MGQTMQAQSRAPKSCGHIHHVGTCGPCQRAQLARWHAQLTQAQGLRLALAPQAEAHR
jgi:hypothetical protein